MTTVNGVYTPSPDPKPHPRVRPEAAEYANRNRGGMENWFDYSKNKSYESPRPAERVISEEAKRNAQTNKGCMSELMGGYADTPVERKIHPRGVTGQAAEIANNNKGQGMRNLMENYGNLEISARPAPKVKGGDAEEYAERNQGKVNTLLNHYGTLTPDAMPAPKVSYGGEEVAEKYKGADMGPLMRMEGYTMQPEPKISKLHQQSEGPGWDEDPPAVRLRPESEAIADRYAETTLDKVVRGEVDPLTIRTPKVQQHLQESTTPRPQTSPVRTRPEAMTNYQRNASSDMGSILRGECDRPVTPRRQNRNQRSELW